MLRELTHEEMGFVSGGDIIVNGIPLQSTVGSGVNDPLAPYMQTGYYGYLATQALVIQPQTAPSDDGVAAEGQNEEIIVNGMTRTDPASNGDEVQAERDNLHMIGGGYGNAEQNPDGTWSIVATLLPTPDQARFEANQDAANTPLMVALIPNAQARANLAAELTDRGIDMSGQNLAALYQEYRSSSSSGSGLTVFVNWVADRISQPPLGN
ncbi:MAG: hypothetical protein ABL859_06410 [Methylotenera sp.]